MKATHNAINLKRNCKLIFEPYRKLTGNVK